MKVLITGFTSRHCNPKASARDVSFAYLIAEALRSQGHDVEHRNPSLTEDLADFDRVIVGVAPLHALGSNRAYGAISAIMRTWSDKLTLMFDDPDTGKIFTGIRTIAEHPERLTKSFFDYKLEWDQASQPEWKEWLAEGVRLLRDATWPPVVVPQNFWAGTPRLVGAHPDQVREIVGIDPTGAMSFSCDSSQEKQNVWVFEGLGKQPWIEKISPFVHTPIEWHGVGGVPRFSSDEARLARYATSRGVLVPPVCDGAWWQSRYLMASACESLVLTDWQTVRPLGAEWTLTPEKADALSNDAASYIANAQCTALLEGAPSTEQIVKTLEGAR